MVRATSSTTSSGSCTCSTRSRRPSPYTATPGRSPGSTPTTTVVYWGLPCSTSRAMSAATRGSLRYSTMSGNGMRPASSGVVMTTPTPGGMGSLNARLRNAMSRSLRYFTSS